MVTKEQFVVQSSFRASLAQFLRFSERSAARVGLTHTQYLLLLHLCGYPGRNWATIAELANRLLASHQATVALVQRCQAKGLVSKRRNTMDKRCVEIHITPNARKLVEQVVMLNRGELGRLRNIFRAMRGSLKNDEARAKAAVRSGA